MLFTVIALGQITCLTNGNKSQLKTVNKKRLIASLKYIALEASGRDCTNNNELLHKKGVLQPYAIQLYVFITVVIKESENKVEGLSPRLRVRVPVKTFLFFAFANKQVHFSRFTCLQKKHVLMYYAHV